MKYIKRYNTRLGKVTYVKRRINHTPVYLLGVTVLVGVFLHNAYLQGQVKTYEKSTIMLTSPVPQEYLIRTNGEVENMILVSPTPTPEPEPVLSERAKGCIKNHPDVAKKLEDAFEGHAVSAIELFCRESSLNPAAVNPSSGALGLVQALPPEKLTKECPDMGLDCQIKWGVRYIENRYGSASAALAHHDLKNWY